MISSLLISLPFVTSFLVSKNPVKVGSGAMWASPPTLLTTLRRLSSEFKPESGDVASAGLAEERTEEFLKPAGVSQLTCVNRRDSADADFPRLRKHWHRHSDRMSRFQ